jgi:hypothetical protein
MIWWLPVSIVLCRRIMNSVGVLLLIQLALSAALWGFFTAPVWVWLQ